MSVVNGFVIALMLLFIAYMSYRLFKRRKLATLLSVCAQLFAVSIAVLSFYNDVEASSLIQVCFILFGVLLPCFFLVIDFAKVMKKIKEQGIYEGFVETIPIEDTDERNMNATLGKINPLLKERQVSEIISNLNIDKEEIMKNIKRSLNQAQLFMSKKDYKGAMDKYEHILKIITNCPGLYYNRGNICYYLGDYAEAAASYGKVLEMNGQQTGDHSETTSVGYDMCSVYYNLGNSQFKLKKYEKALQSYKKSLELNPDLPDAQENVALSLIGLGENEKALEYYRKVAGQDESNCRVRCIISRLLSDTGRFAEAEEEIERTIRLNPAFTEAYEELGRILSKQNKLKEAIEAFRNLISLKPDDHIAHYNLGSSYYKIGMLKEATECFRKVTELKPDSYKSYYNMAVALDELGNRSEAAEAFYKVIDIKPDFIDAYNNLGIVLSMMEKHSEAIEIYEKGIKKNPKESSMFFNLGITLSETGRYREAAAAYRHALAIKPDEYEINYHLGAALTELRNYNDAIEAYKNGLKFKPEDSELFYNIATVYSLLRRYDIAADNLKKAIELNADIKNDARVNRAFDGMRGKSDFRELVS